MNPWTRTILGFLVVSTVSANEPLGPDLLGRVEKFLGTNAVRTTFGFQSGENIDSFTFCQTSWEPKNSMQVQQMRVASGSAASELTEAERVKNYNRIDDFAQVWLVPLEVHHRHGERIKYQLTPDPTPSRFHRELVNLGEDQRFGWWGYMTVPQWTLLQKDFGLKKGEDPLAGNIRALGVRDGHDMTRNSAEAYLVQKGGQAIPHLEKILPTPNFAAAIRVLGNMTNETSATKILVRLAERSDSERATHARHYLISYPRIDAEDKYFQWLDRDAGRTRVLQLLNAAASVNLKRTEPYLPRILERPKSVWEFRTAYELSRKISGKAISKDLLEAEEQIKKFGYASGPGFDLKKVNEAVDRMIHSNDPESAGVLAISLATAVTKGDWRPANEAGIQVLHGLPSTWGKFTALRVAKSVEENREREQLEKVR